MTSHLQHGPRAFLFVAGEKVLHVVVVLTVNVLQRDIQN